MRRFPSIVTVLLSSVVGCSRPVAAPAAVSTAAPASTREAAPVDAWRWTLHGDGAEPRAALRYRHGSGAFACTFTTENRTETTMLARPMEVKGRYVVDVRRDPAGRFVASLASYDVDGALLSPLVYRAAGSPSMTFDVDTRGSVHAVTFAPYRPLSRTDPAVVALEKERDASEPLDLRQLERLLGPLRRQMEQVLRSSVETIWTPLPESPVGAGASWTVTKDWSSPGVNAGAMRVNEMRRTYVLTTAPGERPDAAIVVEHTTTAVTREAGPEVTSESSSKGNGRTAVRLAGGAWNALGDHDVRESGEANGTITYEDLAGAKKAKPFESATSGRLRVVCK